MAHFWSLEATFDVCKTKAAIIQLGKRKDAIMICSASKPSIANETAEVTQFWHHMRFGKVPEFWSRLGNVLE